MRTICYLLSLSLFFLSACSTPLRLSNPPLAQTVIYHVKRGAEDELEALLVEIWQTYTKFGMVYPEPHVCVKIRESGGNLRFIEIFTWNGLAAAEHPPDLVNQ